MANDQKYWLTALKYKTWEYSQRDEGFSVLLKPTLKLGSGHPHEEAFPTAYLYAGCFFPLYNALYSLIEPLQDENGTFTLIIIPIFGAMVVHNMYRENAKPVYLGL